MSLLMTREIRLWSNLLASSQVFWWVLLPRDVRETTVMPGSSGGSRVEWAQNSLGVTSSLPFVSFSGDSQHLLFCMQEDRPNSGETGGPDRGHPGTWVLKNDQAPMLRWGGPSYLRGLKTWSGNCPTFPRWQMAAHVPREAVSHTGCCGGHL